MSKRYTIHERRELACMVGIPAPCVWATVFTGFFVNVWNKYADGEEVCTSSRDGFATRAAAEQWGKREVA